MVCSHAASGYLFSNYILVDVNWFNRRDCDVNPGEHERINKLFIDEEKKTMELTLFLENGKTLRFENVTNLEKRIICDEPYYI